MRVLDWLVPTLLLLSLIRAMVVETRLRAQVRMLADADDIRAFVAAWLSTGDIHRGDLHHYELYIGNGAWIRAGTLPDLFNRFVAWRKTQVARAPIA